MPASPKAAPCLKKRTPSKSSRTRRPLKARRGSKISGVSTLMAHALGKSPVLVGSFSRNIGKGVSALFLQVVGQSLR